MKREEKALHYLIFMMGLFINAFGVALVTKANLGTSPISSIPYTLSLGYAPSLGMFTFYFSILLVILQILIMKKHFPREYFLQIPISILFSYLIDLSMFWLAGLNPSAYLQKMMILLAGCMVLGLGVFLEKAADVVMLPGEAFVNAVSVTYRQDFGKVKVIFDVSISLIALGLGFSLYGSLKGVGEGTVIASVLIGSIAGYLNRKFFFSHQ